MANISFSSKGNEPLTRINYSGKGRFHIVAYEPVNVGDRL